MSAHVRILDFKITPHTADDRVLRFFLPGDMHVDFILPNEVHDKLAAHFTPDACPLATAKCNEAGLCFSNPTSDIRPPTSSL